MPPDCDSTLAPIAHMFATHRLHIDTLTVTNVAPGSVVGEEAGGRLVNWRTPRGLNSSTQPIFHTFRGVSRAQGKRLQAVPQRYLSYNSALADHMEVLTAFRNLIGAREESPFRITQLYLCMPA